MMEFYITSLLQILCFSSHFRRFEMKIFLRRPTMMAENISQLVTPPPPSPLWWTIKAKLFLRTILISKVNYFFMFYLNLKLNLKFISNSVSYRNQFKFHFILVFNFKLTSKAILFFLSFQKLDLKQVAHECSQPLKFFYTQLCVQHMTHWDQM